MSGPALFPAIALLISLLGGLAIYAWSAWSDIKDRAAKIDFEAEMQPNLERVADHQPFDQDAILTERPLLASEYPPLPADHRLWKAGR